MIRLQYSKKSFLLYILNLLTPLWMWPDSTSCGTPSLVLNIQTIKHAESLFYEHHYSEAIPLYSQLVSSTPPSDLKTEFELRLATSYLENGDSQKVLELLAKSGSPPNYFNDSFPPLLSYHRLLLISSALRQLKNPSQALYFLQQAPLHNEFTPPLLLLEESYHLIKLGNLTKAKEILQLIPWKIENPFPYNYARLQMAKIAYLEEQFKEALEILYPLSNSFSENHPLHIATLCLMGWTFLANNQIKTASDCFEKLLPRALSSKHSPTNIWETEVLRGYITSHLKQQCNASIEPLIQLIIARAPTEKSHLLLADFHLIQAKNSDNRHAYLEAKRSIDGILCNFSPQNASEVLIKLADAAPSYLERNELYEQLLCNFNDSSHNCGKIWFLKGINELQEGMNRTKTPLQRSTFFEKAITAFTHAAQLHDGIQAQKFLAYTYVHFPGQSYVDEAWTILNELKSNPSINLSIKDQKEIDFLSGWVALRLKNREYLQTAKTALLPYQNEHALLLAGRLAMQLSDWTEADQLFNQIVENPAFIQSHGEAWFWKGHCAKQQENSLFQSYFQNTYILHPHSPYASLAYFHYYSYREYVSANKKAIKHLQAMPRLFPKDPLLITACYLIGLHHKKDHFSNEGIQVRRRDLTKAIDAFQEAENQFDLLYENNDIAQEELLYIIQTRTQSKFERAHANLLIGQTSIGGKREIYLDYAEKVFQELIEEFNSPLSTTNQLLLHTSYPKVWAASYFELAKINIEKGRTNEAEMLLNTSLKHYEKAKIISGYGLVRTWHTKGQLAQQKSENEKALYCFSQAEKASHNDIGLKLEIWIQQSACHRELKQLDQAMQLLSKVINEDIISPLRVKAMFLRSEIYELQGRPELALKQLEATSHKGGEWSEKAKQKLEQDYGYTFNAAGDLRKHL